MTAIDYRRPTDCEGALICAKQTNLTIKRLNLNLNLKLINYHWSSFCNLNFSGFKFKCFLLINRTPSPPFPKSLQDWIESRRRADTRWGQEWTKSAQYWDTGIRKANTENTSSIWWPKKKQRERVKRIAKKTKLSTHTWQRKFTWPCIRR
jgi:hypothetical protein